MTCTLMSIFISAFIIIRMLDGGSDIVQKILTSVQNGVHTKLVDFGCHLDSIDKDWTNPTINTSIDGMIA